MNKQFIILPLFFLLEACAANIPVNVVNHTPKNCAYVTTVSVSQCSAGLLGKVETTRDTLKIMKKEAVKNGGNTLECCVVEDEETVFSGVNPKSGLIVCVGMVQHSSNVYKCEN